ncbi:Uncharacterised protein [Streptococcus pyogenes]|nr:Uncharacterised protein [Streptococcus pyogenes]
METSDELKQRIGDLSYEVTSMQQQNLPLQGNMMIFLRRVFMSISSVVRSCFHHWINLILAVVGLPFQNLLKIVWSQTTMTLLMG